MKLIKIHLWLFVLVLLIGCYTTIPMNQKFYNQNKVGIILEVDSIGMAKSGSQGILDHAFTPGNKFKEPLKKIESKLFLNDSLSTEISKMLIAKNKQFLFIKDIIIIDSLKKFQSPDENKKYHNKDFREFKIRYQVDEIIYLKVKYGLMISYYGMIETGKQGYINHQSVIVDLNDNSILQQENINEYADLKGNWKEGEDYIYLKEAIQDAIHKSYITLKSKF